MGCGAPPAPEYTGGQRIVALQHGDYVDALRICRSSEPEPYFGMRDSVAALGRLFGARPHLVVSLSAPTYDVCEGQGRYVSFARPAWPRPVLSRLGHLRRHRAIASAMRRFEPTHLLLRTTVHGICEPALEMAIRRRLPTLAVFAGAFSATTERERKRFRRLCSLLNDDTVHAVGNHRWPATNSMLEFGLRAEKARAYDWLGGREPSDHPPRRPRSGPELRVFYAGSITAAKGVDDVVAAAGILRARGRNVRLTVAGDGPELDRLRAHPDASAGHVSVLGRISNDAAFGRMLDADICCVPSRHEFAEGMPMVLTEALASRTPVVVSDHRVFRAAFRDGEGVVMFRASDPQSLSDAIERVAADPDLYERLSRDSAAAFERVRCVTDFGGLLADWAGACLRADT